MTQKSEVTIEIIWYRMPALWLLILAVAILALALTWTLGKYAYSALQLDSSLSELSTLKSQMTLASEENAQITDLRDKERKTHEDSLREKNLKVAELISQLAEERTRADAADRRAAQETKLRTVLENQLSATTQQPSNQNATPGFVLSHTKVGTFSSFDLPSCKNASASALSKAGVNKINTANASSIHGEIESNRVIVLCLVDERTLVFFTVGRDPIAILRPHHRRVVDEVMTRYR